MGKELTEGKYRRGDLIKYNAPIIDVIDFGVVWAVGRHPSLPAGGTDPLPVGHEGVRLSAGAGMRWQCTKRSPLRAGES